MLLEKSTSQIPINKVGLYSYIFTTWLSPLIWRMYRKRKEPIVAGDVWACSEKEGVKANEDRVKCLWTRDLGKYGPEKASFFRVWVKFVLARTLAALVITSIAAFSSFLLSAYFVQLILEYLESDEDNMLYGIGLTIAVAMAAVIKACTTSAGSLYGLQTEVENKTLTLLKSDKQ